MTETRPLSKSQIDRLGERLRASAEISEEDLAVLQRYQLEHSEALRVVQETIDRTLPGISQTGRVKTVGTLHDKLRRQPTKLSRVYDIAGVRIVRDVVLTEQDEIVAKLVAAFPGARVKDRRAHPTFGYRAVHVIVRLDRCLVEIQVRTIRQHLWAEIVERLGDRWGRQIRYGGLPLDPDVVITGDLTRRALWEIVQTVGEVLGTVEDGLDLEAKLTQAGKALPAETARQFVRLNEKADGLLQTLAATAASGVGL